MKHIIYNLVCCAFCSLFITQFPAFVFAQAGAEKAIYFDLNAATLSATATHTLDDLLSTDKINKNQHLLLYGYADYLGTRAHNDSLSTERAMNARGYLIGKGIPEKNITVCVGKGQIQRTPTSGHTGYAKDRKVEIITDEGKIKKLTCNELAKFEPLKWSKNVNQLNVHAANSKPDHKMTDETIAVRLPNGDKYIGEITATGEKRNGGNYVWASGESYTGDYENDKKQGHGSYTWANGDVLEGQWQNDDILLGQLTIPYDGVLYHSDANHTHSDVTYKGALTYKGGFKNHMFNGNGIATWPNGDSYSGGWKNDLMDGKGEYKWANGVKYVGDWKDNKINGAGRMLRPDGTIFQQGTWENDVYSGH